MTDCARTSGRHRLPKRAANSAWSRCAPPVPPACATPRITGVASASRKTPARRRTIAVVVLASPVVLFDLLDLFLAQTEVVADLVNQRLADADDEIVVVFCLALVGTLKDQHAIRQRVAVTRRALGQRRALIEPEQRVGRLDLHLVEQLRGRFVLYNDGDVLHGVAEVSRDGGER